MKKTTILYRIFTALLILFMAPGAVMEIMHVPSSDAILEHLKYPLYLSSFLGTAKLLGSIALLVPGFPRIKEWVYAGFVFDLTGATWSGLASGDPIVAMLPMLLGYAFIALSYTFYHKRLKQQSGVNAQQPAVQFGVS
jgi:uncharacterized membrane protein YphA (DoxX/SURF4 family)